MKKSLLNISVIMALSFTANAADLSEIFKQSEAHDPQLSSAKYILEASMEGKKQAFSAFLPTVNASLDNNFGKSKSVSQFAQNPSSQSESSSWGVSIKQTLYNHANYKNYQISELQILKSTSDYNIAYQDFVLRVAQNYFEVLASQDNLIFSKAEEKAIQRQLDQAEQRFEVGLAAITDVHEARATYDGARAAVIIANNRVEDSNEALFEMTQKYYPQLSNVPHELNYDSHTLDTLDSLEKTGLSKSPELIASEINKDIAEKNIAVSKSGHYPTLSLSFSRSQRYSPYEIRNIATTDGVVQIDTGSSTSDSNSIGLSLSIPIYSGGKTSSQVRQSAFQHSSAMDKYEQTRRGTIRKVRNAYHGSIAAKSSIEARKLAMISAQSGLEATEAGYEVGTRTIVDVLLSQKRLYQAQRDFSKAKYDYFIQYLTLKRATGDLSESDITAINKILE